MPWPSNRVGGQGAFPRIWGGFQGFGSCRNSNYTVAIETPIVGAMQVAVDDQAYARADGETHRVWVGGLPGPYPHCCVARREQTRERAIGARLVARRLGARQLRTGSGPAAHRHLALRLVDAVGAAIEYATSV